MKKLLDLLFYTGVVLLISVVIACLYLDIVGVPRRFHPELRSFLRGQGINLQFSNIRIALWGRVRINDLVVYDGLESESEIMWQAESMSLWAGPGDWLAGRFSPNSIQVRKLNLLVPLTEAPERRGQAENISFKINQLSLALSGNEWRLQRFDGELLGLRLHGDATLVNPPVVATDQKSIFSWDLFPRLFDQQIQESLVQLRQWSRGRRLAGLRGELSLRGSLSLDFARPRDFILLGEFDFSGLPYQNLVWQKLTGSFSFDEGQWLGSEIRAGSEESLLTGDIAYFPATGEVAGNLAGKMVPRNVYQIFDRPMPDWLARTQFLTPPLVELKFGGPVGEMAQGWVKGNFDVRNLVFRNLHLQRLSGNISYGNERLEWSDLLTIPMTDSRIDEQVTGSGRYCFAKDQLIAQLRGRIAPAAVAELVRATAWRPHWLDDLEFSAEPATFLLEISDGRLVKKEWRGKLGLALSKFKIRDLEVDRLTAELQLDGDRLTTDNPVFVKLAGARELISLEFMVELEKRLVSGHGSGGVYFPRRYRELGLPELKPLQWLHFHGLPPTFDLTLEPSPYDQLTDWRLSGELSGSNIEYEDLVLDSVETSVEMADGRVRFERISAVSPAFEQVELDYLELTLTRPELRMAGQVAGNPARVEVFIPRGPSRRAYNRVLRDFTWSRQVPRIELDHLYYSKFPDGQTPWRVTLAARIEGEELVYRGVSADTVSARLELALPEQVRIEEIKAANDRSSGEKLSGRLEFELDGDPRWHFSCEGSLDPARIFAAVGPTAKTSLERFVFTPDTEIEMAGTVFMRGGGRSRLSGTFSGPGFVFYGIDFQAYELGWELADHHLRWRLAEAEMHGGIAKGNGYYNRFSGIGTASLDLNQVAVSKLLEDLGRDQQIPDLGRLTATAYLDYRPSGREADLNITGRGRLQIREAKFWDAPLLKNLGDAVGLSSLGRISELEADIEFIGDRVKVHDLQTDGTVFSLEGKGEYEWGRRYTDFYVRGQALRTTALLGTVLRPLSWLFEARLTGQLDEAKWSAVPLGGIMSGNRREE